MKKVLFAMPDLRGGGAEKVLIDILKKIDKKKFEITLLLFTRTGVHINEIPKEVKVICIKEKLKIELPFIIDSPMSGEVNIETANLMLKIARRELGESQIIAVSYTHLTLPTILRV